MRSVLIIEDEHILANNMATYLGREFFNVSTAYSLSDAYQLLELQSYDFILLDYNLPDGDGLEFLNKVLPDHPNTPIIMITGESSVEIAVKAMKSGAADYVTKPLVLKELLVLLNKQGGLKKIKSYRDYHHRRSATKGEIEQIRGESEKILGLKQKISQIVSVEQNFDAANAPSVLISGETGTGKELVAKAIHFSGHFSDEPFVEINCSAIPKELLEAELFGCEKGAFTGAQKQRVGLIESAEGGTLFIDEIGDMDINLQAKILKVIEDKTYRRLGDSRQRKANVRFVSATHRNIKERISQGLFREDLYYRLKVISIEVPSLRQRTGDVDVLSRHFLQEFCNKYMKPKTVFSSSAQELLNAHRWPGNVRELRACVEQAVLMNTTGTITPTELSLSSGISKTFDMPNHFPVEGISLEEIEKGYLTQALDRSNGNITKAAKMLGLSRDTLRYRLEKYRIT
jgi:two-component system, NtrC family, response regulator AtoC